MCKNRGAFFLLAPVLVTPYSNFKMAALVTFEGGEGSGKSTQIKKLGETLSERGIPHLATREPGGTELGKKIRALLLQGEVGSIDPMTELMLYAADRAEHVRRMIMPALASGKIVLCDRFTDATVAYQGHGRRLDLKLIAELNDIATSGLKPTLTFLFDCPVEVGLKRSHSRLQKEKSSEDRFEREALDFHQRVRQAYQNIAAENTQRFCVLDASQDIDTLQALVLKKVEALLKGAGHG